MVTFSCDDHIYYYTASLLVYGLLQMYVCRWSFSSGQVALCSSQRRGKTQLRRTSMAATSDGQKYIVIRCICQLYYTEIVERRYMYTLLF